MSIAAFTISEMAVAAQAPAQKGGGKPPRYRLVTAKADQTELPEPR